MIPKIIHYCWFGKSEKNSLLVKCIDSWKKKLPDYKLMEWNENNFDINSNEYVKQAYQCGKYAFVSDYVRLFALKNYGGIYLDTDVEVLSTFNPFLESEITLGFESENRIATAIIMAGQNNPLICQWLNTYHTRKFKMNGKMDMTTNVFYLTQLLEQKGLLLNGENQILEKNICIYNKQYFAPYSLGDSTVRVVPETVCIHWCDGSWVCGKKKIKHFCIKYVKKILGTKKYNSLRKLFVSRIK